MGTPRYCERNRPYQQGRFFKSRMARILMDVTDHGSQMTQIVMDDTDPGIMDHR